MATQTTNYHFTKPDMSDPASPVPFNNNFDSLDSILNNVVTTANQAASVAAEANAQSANAINYIDTKLGEIGTLLDDINGEVV